MSTERTITALTEEWVALLQNSGEEAALDFYCENILPELLPTLHERFKRSYGFEPQYDGLISLLGFAPDTVILAYQFLKPKKLAVIHTEATTRFLDTIQRYTQIPMDLFSNESFTETPHVDIYRALKDALKKFPRGSRVAIELTGGKKTMSGALAVASGILDIDLIYIDYTKYMPEFRKPRPESTFIHLIGNPLKLPIDLFSEVEIGRSSEFLNIGRRKYDIKLPLLEEDETGVIRVGGTRVLLELVIRAFQDGATPEAIVQRYSSLSLSDVYLIVGYYLQHQDDVNAYLEQREQQAESTRQRLLSVQPDLSSIRSRLLAQQQP
jgi:uncharacterized protein (DUF433 family)